MTIKYPIVAEFESFEKITDPKERNKIREDITNRHDLTGMDGLRAFYEKMGFKFDEEMFEELISDCISHFQGS